MSKSNGRRNQSRSSSSMTSLYIVVGVLALAFLATFFAWRSGQKGGVNVGAKAPDITVRDLQGNAVKLSSINKPVLVTFWQTTCPACQSEFVTLQALWTEANKNGSPPWTLMLVDIGESPDTVRAFMAEHNYDLPVYVDPSATSGDAHGVYYIPANFFLDASHKIRSKSDGALPGPEFKARLDALTR
ncbi:MAG: TlpA family protein disulfide reductase [Bacillota bacterium]